VERFELPDVDKLKRRRDVDGLIRALAYSSVRLEAVRALGEIGEERAVERLVRALGHEDWLMRAAAADALGKIGDERAVERLVAALGDKSPGVQERAAVALAEIGDERVVERLVAALEDKNPGVQVWAAVALAEIGDERAVERLVTALGRSAGDKSLGVQDRAAVALGKIGDERAVEPLLSALGRRSPGDEDREMRMSAAHALGEIGDERAVERLVVTLGDRDSGVQKRAVVALGRIGGSRASSALVGLLTEKSGAEDVERAVIDRRRAAAEALAGLENPGESALEPLIVALKDERYFRKRDINPDFRSDVEEEEYWFFTARLAVMKALRRVGGPEAERALDEHGMTADDVSFVLERVLNLRIDPDEAVEDLVAARPPEVVVDVTEQVLRRRPSGISGQPPEENEAALNDVCKRTLKRIVSREGKQVLARFRN